MTREECKVVLDGIKQKIDRGASLEDIVDDTYELADTLTNYAEWD